MTERDRIVDWLRGRAEHLDALQIATLKPTRAILILADAIERGEHLKRPEPTIPASEWKNSPSVGH